MTFEMRQIGKTDVRVSAMSFGCASIGNLYQEVSDESCADVLQAAWAAGIRYFDTAPRYGRGRAEARLGAFLKDKAPSSYVISTKVGRVLRPGAAPAEAEGFVKPLQNSVHEDYSADGIAESLEGSRMRLGTGYIDIIYVHDIGTYTHGEKNADHMDALRGSGMEYLIRLKEQGKIGAIGLGVNENEICLEIMKEFPIDAILLAGRLTLLDRSAEEALVPLCLKTDTSLVLGGIFNSGILATGPKPGATYDYALASKAILEATGTLEKKAQCLGISLAQASIQFALNHPAAASVLIGTAKSSSLNRNVILARKPVPSEFQTVFDLI